MSWLLVGAVVPSLLLAWSAGFVVRRFAEPWGLVDRPGHRKVHTRPTPLGGGLAIWLGVVAPLGLGYLALALGGETLATWAQSSDTGARRELARFVAPHVPGLWAQGPRLGLLLAAGTVMMLLGLADDRRGLDWRLRLGVEFLVAIAIVAFGWRGTLFVDWPWLTGAVSVLWIVGLVNSFNMLDNMDGLSGGVATIAAALLAAVLLLAPDPETQRPQWFVAGLLLVIVGAVVGFLWHNRPPARLFMGDAGAYFLGFMIAVCSLLATFAGRDLPSHALLAPLCVLAVPLYDTATVVLIRLRAGRSPFEADKNHFSHRLVELGLTKPQAVLTIYLTTATCGLGALLLHQVNGWGAVVILLLVVCVLSLVAVLEWAARRNRGAP